MRTVGLTFHEDTPVSYTHLDAADGKHAGGQRVLADAVGCRKAGAVRAFSGDKEPASPHLQAHGPDHLFQMCIRDSISTSVMPRGPRASTL